MDVEYIEIDCDVSPFLIGKSGLNENDDIRFDLIVDIEEWVQAISVAGLSELFLKVMKKHYSVERNGYWVHNILTKRGILEVIDINDINETDLYEGCKVKLHIIRDGDDIRLRYLCLFI